MRLSIRCLLLSFILPSCLLSQGTPADFARANSLEKRTENTLFGETLKLNWTADSSAFWYLHQTGPKTSAYVLVDATSGAKSPLFDSAALAAQLAQATAKPAPDSANLRLIQLTFLPLENALTFQFARQGWRWDRAKNQLTSHKIEAATLTPLGGRAPSRSLTTGDQTEITFVNLTETPLRLFWLNPEGKRVSYGELAPGQTRQQHTFAGHVWLITDLNDEPRAHFEAEAGGSLAEINPPGPAPRKNKSPAAASAKDRPRPAHTSPDGKWRIRTHQFNLSLENLATKVTRALTTDGTEADGFRHDVAWAPDSSAFAAQRVRWVAPRQVTVVESSPDGQLQPKTQTFDYRKPGDALPKPTAVVYTVADAKLHPFPTTLYENPFTENGDIDFTWAEDSSEVYFNYNQRGHQLYRVLAASPRTGALRTVIEETSATFIEHQEKTWRHWLHSTRELLWMSERSDWCHLYLYDSATGRLKNAVTSGNWVVRDVVHVDEAARQLYILASGLRSGEDPYHTHLCRVNFDGSGFIQLTTADANHLIAFSPNHRTFVANASRLDLAPVITLHRASDGAQLAELSRSDPTALLATGWTLPERFAAKGRDGTTDIYGYLIKPSNFDPLKKYPVIEYIYAGPHSAHVPKNFNRLINQHALAELGFILVQIDGMGTDHRGKIFHNVAWKNLQDAGFPDRIAWIKAAAATRPWMNLDRVGIYGTSAGGQNAMRAVLDHADFYRAAVADCGCHDNRMDKIWWNEQWLGWPVDDSYLRASNLVDAPKLGGALLLLVGELDHNVDPASTTQVINALVKADKTFDSLIVPGAGHGTTRIPHVRRRLMEFFVEHLIKNNCSQRLLER